MENDAPFFTLEGSYSSLLIVNISAAATGCLLLVPFLFLPGYGLVFGLFAFPSVAIWILADTIIWRKRGVQAVHFYPNEVRFFRGINRSISVIPTEQIIDVHVHRRLNRRTLTIMLEQKVQHIPGVLTYYPGKRVRFSCDAFDDKEFDRAIYILQLLVNKKNR